MPRSAGTRRANRRFLNDFFNERKHRDPTFSHRYFAKLAKSNSSGLLKDVINGRTNIEPGLIRRYSKAFGLNKSESRYFKTLVFFNQAKTTPEKNRYFEILMTFFRKKGHILPSQQYEYYTKWYYPAIRELLSIINFKDNYRALARRLRPRITSEKAKSAIKTLIRLEMIKKNASGYYKAVEDTVTAGPEVHSLTMANFQRAMLQLCIEAIDRFPKEDREISTLTYSIAKEDLPLMKAELVACRERLKGIAQRSKKMDTICQLNIGLFPLYASDE